MSEAAGSRAACRVTRRRFSGRHACHVRVCAAALSMLLPKTAVAEEQAIRRVRSRHAREGRGESLSPPSFRPASR